MIYVLLTIDFDFTNRKKEVSDNLATENKLKEKD